MRNCSACKFPIVENANFCDNCGEKVELVIICTNCETENQQESKFCSNCGNKIGCDTNTLTNRKTVEGEVFINKSNTTDLYKQKSVATKDDSKIDTESNQSAPTKETNSTTWFYRKNGQVYGAYDFEKILKLTLDNTISFDTEVSSDNQENWQEAKIIVNQNAQRLNQDLPKVWFYSRNGDREGPFTEFEMRLAIEKEKIRHGDAVYKEGRQNWVAVEDTELKKYIHTPPPMLGENAPNGSIWWVAFSPLISSIALLLIMSFSWEQYIQTNVQAYADLYHFLSNWGVVVYILFNLIFIGIDSSKLKNLGHDADQFGSIFWIPVYIWKRNKILQKTQASFWIWMILTFFDVLIGPALM